MLSQLSLHCKPFENFKLDMLADISFTNVTNALHFKYDNNYSCTICPLLALLHQTRSNHPTSQPNHPTNCPTSQPSDQALNHLPHSRTHICRLTLGDTDTDTLTHTLMQSNKQFVSLSISTKHLCQTLNCIKC